MAREEAKNQKELSMRNDELKRNMQIEVQQSKSLKKHEVRAMEDQIR